jgi:hypothetical protein
MGGGMDRPLRWIHRNRRGLLGAALGFAMIGLIAAPLAFGAGIIGFAAGHWLDRRADAEG